MAGEQLPLFQRKTYKGIISPIPLAIRPPDATQTILQTLPAYYAYLQSGGFSPYTPDDFTGDMKKFGLFVKDKALQDITEADIQQWISFLKTAPPQGEGLRAKTISRKLSTLTNYCNWLIRQG